MTLDPLFLIVKNHSLGGMNLMNGEIGSASLFTTIGESDIGQRPYTVNLPFTYGASEERAGPTQGAGQRPDFVLGKEDSH